MPWTHWLSTLYSLSSAEVKPRPTGPTTINVMVGDNEKITWVNVQGKTYLLIDGKQVPVRKTLETLDIKSDGIETAQTVVVTFANKTSKKKKKKERDEQGAGAYALNFC